MGIFKFIGKVAASAITGTAGLVAETIEKVGAASGCTPLADLGHSAKSAGYNATRKIWGKESKEYKHEDGSDIANSINRAMKNRDAQIAKREQRIKEFEKKHPGVNTEKIQKAKEQLAKAKGITKSRRTDSALEQDTSGLDRKATDYQHCQKISLPQAVSMSDSTTGVYVLFLNGKVMKCGRAAYGQGVHWRLQQYYSLNYDDRARRKDYWSITPENRDSVMVSWQCCPVSKCKELEYKLFKKYGKGPWGLRAPLNCPDNSWDLLI